MFHPCRGGVRGGKDQFSWDDVKKDKDREYYLGHSIKAPVGRWQDGKDLHWYNSDAAGDKDSQRNAEFARAKELEEEALMAALGYKVVKKEKQEPEREIKNEYRSRSDRDRNDRVSVQLPSLIDTSSKKKIDKLLIRLMAKYSRNEILDALGADLAKKKEKSKHRRSSDDDSSSSSGSSDDDKKKRKKKSSKSSKKRRRSKSDSSDSD